MLLDDSGSVLFSESSAATSSPSESTGSLGDVDIVPVGLALAAGTLAVVNTCGFALLSACASLLVVGDDSPGRAVAVGRALVFAGTMTAGFAGMFGLFGLLLVPASGAVQRHLPWVALTLGLLLLALCGWLVAGRTLPGLRIATRGGVPLTRSVTMAGVGVVMRWPHSAAPLARSLPPWWPASEHRSSAESW